MALEEKRPAYVVGGIFVFTLVIVRAMLLQRLCLCLLLSLLAITITLLLSVRKNWGNPLNLGPELYLFREMRA